MPSREARALLEKACARPGPACEQGVQLAGKVWPWTRMPTPEAIEIYISRALKLDGSRCAFRSPSEAFGYLLDSQFHDGQAELKPWRGVGCYAAWR